MLPNPNCFEFFADADFSELTLDLSIRSKATLAKSYPILRAYRKQIIKNQRKQW